MQISGALSSAISGLAANAQTAAAVAGNVANVNTQGYQAARVSTASVAAGGPGGRHSPGGVRVSVIRDGGVDLTEQFVQLIQAEVAYSANAQVIKTTGEVSARLLDVLA